MASTNSLETSLFPLDNKHTSDPALWIVYGGHCSLIGIGNLASPLAPRKVLQFFAHVLAQRLGLVWEMGAVLSGVMSAMAARE